MSDRFFIDQPIKVGEVALSGPEAHHLIHVMRASVGQRVVVFDGLGHEAIAEVSGIQKKSVTLRIEDWTSVSRELPTPIVVASPLPKGDRERFLIEKLTELGVTSFVPLITQRTVVRPDDKAIERLRRVVIEASKQCGRNHLMTVQTPERWADFLVSVQNSEGKLFAHPVPHSQIPAIPRGCPTRATVGIASNGLPFAFASQEVVIAAGPEGGFTDEEAIEAIRMGWVQVDLGPRVLRTETAAIVLATLVGLARQVRILGGDSPATPPESQQE